jgi:DNA-binding transcriptional MerR regulator
VSVQTLRHYDKLGLLRPSRVTAAGYRLYSALECAQLDLIRTLREVGFDLETIALLISAHANPRAAVKLQLETLDAQMRSLRRQCLLLEAVMNGDEAAILPRLRQLNVLVKLNKLEREAFLATQLGWNPDDRRGSRAVWEAATMHLPETLDETQLEDWLELAQIASDESFHATLRRQWQSFEAVDDGELERWTTLSQTLIERSRRALEASELPSSTTAQRIALEWLQGLATVLSRTPDAEFEIWTLEVFASTSDSRIHRYWELISRLKGTAFSDAPTRAFTWLLDAVRYRVQTVLSD